MGYSLAWIFLFLATTSGFGPAQQSCFRRTAFTPEIKTPWTLRVAESGDGEGSSSTIRKMSWFLTTQLLETALKEVAKGEEESKMSMGDLEKLASVLQRTEERVTQENEQVLQQQVSEEEEAPETELEAVGEEDEGDSINDTDSESDIVDEFTALEDPDAAEEAGDPPSEDEFSTVMESDVVEEPVDAQSAATPQVSESDMEDEDIQDSPIAEEVKEQPVESLEIEETSLKTADLPDTVAKNESLLSGVARIPAVISTTFGRSLEVVASAVPPLGQSTVPQPSSEQELTKTPEVVPAESTSSDDEIDTTTPVETPAGNSLLAKISGFNRKENGSKLSQTEENIEQALKQPKSKEEENALSLRYGQMKIEDRAFEILKDLGMFRTDSGPEVPESTAGPTKNVSLEPISSNSLPPILNTAENTGNTTTPGTLPASEAISIENDSNEEESVTLLSNEKSTPSKRRRFLRPIRNMIDKSRQTFLSDRDASFVIDDDEDDELPEVILHARQQPKSPQEEAELAEKYANMPLEDRAYAILCDLGII